MVEDVLLRLGKHWIGRDLKERVAANRESLGECGEKWVGRGFGGQRSILEDDAVPSYLKTVFTVPARVYMTVAKSSTPLFSSHQRSRTRTACCPLYFAKSTLYIPEEHGTSLNVRPIQTFVPSGSSLILLLLVVQHQTKPILTKFPVPYAIESQDCDLSLSPLRSPWWHRC